MVSQKSYVVVHGSANQSFAGQLPEVLIGLVLGTFLDAASD